MKESPKMIQQYQNFQSALKKLVEFTNEPVVNDRDKAGIIQAFEFTFEQCWKFFQKKAESVSEIVPGPKPALEIALRYGWIQTEHEELWLGMLRDRNMTSHLYREDISLAIFERVTRSYLPILKTILIN